MSQLLTRRRRKSGLCNKGIDVGVARSRLLNGRGLRRGYRGSLLGGELDRRTAYPPIGDSFGRRTGVRDRFFLRILAAATWLPIKGGNHKCYNGCRSVWQSPAMGRHAMTPSQQQVVPRYLLRKPIDTKF